MINAPQTYDEAVNRNDSNKWKAAMDNEMNSLKKNHYHRSTREQNISWRKMGLCFKGRHRKPNLQSKICCQKSQD